MGLSQMPDEILLEILSYLPQGPQNRNGQRTLRSVALSCKGLSRTSQEALCHSPSVNAQKVDSMLRFLFKNPNFPGKIRSLAFQPGDILAKRESRVDDDLSSVCASLINVMAINYSQIRRWIRIIRFGSDNVGALISLLLMLLPNLEELYLGETLLQDLPFLHGVVVDKTKYSKSICHAFTNSVLRQPDLSFIFRRIAQKLKVFEFANDFRSHPIGSPGFYDNYPNMLLAPLLRYGVKMTNLRTIIVPGIVNKETYVFGYAIPPSVETLVIYDVWADPTNIQIWLRDIQQNRTKRQFHPKLKQIVVFFTMFEVMMRWAWMLRRLAHGNGIQCRTFLDNQNPVREYSMEYPWRASLVEVEIARKAPVSTVWQDWVLDATRFIRRRILSEIAPAPAPASAPENIQTLVGNACCIS